MDVISFHSFWTVLTLFAFIMLIVWAWSGKRHQQFDKASRIPLEDDMDTPPNKENSDE